MLDVREVGDLVVGCIEGYVWFVENESGSKELSFRNGVKLSAGEKEINVGHGDSGPAIADWDGDGTLDLIVGAGDGSVQWYPNASRAGPWCAPRRWAWACSCSPW